MSLHAVPDQEPAAYSELSETEQVNIQRGAIKELEQKLFIARANAAMQSRLINSPISEARKSTAKRTLRDKQDEMQDLQISIAVLREGLADLEAILPAKEDDGGATRADDAEGSDEGDAQAADPQAGPRRGRYHRPSEEEVGAT